MDIIIMGHIGTTIRTHAFIPSSPTVSLDCGYAKVFMHPKLHIMPLDLHGVLETWKP